MKEAGILDTGFLLATLNVDDSEHEACAPVFAAEHNLLLPDVVLPELAYLILRDLNYQTLVEFMRMVANGDLPLERTTAADLERAND